MSDSPSFIDLFDWEVESDRHYMRMLEGPYFEEEGERLPAKIVVKIKPKKNDKYKTTRGGSSEKKKSSSESLQRKSQG